MNRYFLSCVPAPKGFSGLLLREKQKNGYIGVVLFQDSRNMKRMIRDAYRLWDLIKSECEVTPEIQANVNGSICRFLILAACILQRPKRRCLPVFVIMDVYPGSLKIVSRFWWFWYPTFLFLELINLSISRTIIVIDEGFYDLVPLKFFKRKINLERLFYTARSERPHKAVRYIGIIGNIYKEEEKQIRTFLDKIQTTNLKVLLASSSDCAFCFDHPVISARYIPWKLDDTESVMNKLDFIFITGSLTRLKYNSPSKILDAYSRGIQPILDISDKELDNLRGRALYHKCATLNQVIRSEFNFDPEVLQSHAFKYWRRV